MPCEVLMAIYSVLRIRLLALVDLLVNSQPISVQTLRRCSVCLSPCLSIPLEITVRMVRNSAFHFQVKMMTILSELVF